MANEKHFMEEYFFTEEYTGPANQPAAIDPEIPEPSDLELRDFPLIDSTKRQRDSFVKGMIEAMESGFVDPLKVHLQVKNMENIVDRLTNKKDYPETANAYTDLLQDAAARHPKSFEFRNGKFTAKEAGVRYDFTTCGDPVWDALNAEMNELKAKVKEREDFLKKVPAGGLEFICDGGEVATVYPPLKHSTTSIAVTLK